MDSSILKQIGAQSSQRYKELKSNINISESGTSIKELYEKAKSEVKDISEDTPSYDSSSSSSSSKAAVAATWLNGISQVLQGASACLAEVGKWNSVSGSSGASNANAPSLGEQKANLETQIQNYDTMIAALENDEKATEYATNIKNELVNSSNIAQNAESNILKFCLR